MLNHWYPAMPLPDVAALSDEEHGGDVPASSVKKRKLEENVQVSQVVQRPNLTVNLRKLVRRKCQCSKNKCMEHFQDDGKQRELRALRLHLMSMNKLDSDKFATCIKYVF